MIAIPAYLALCSFLIFGILTGLFYVKLFRAETNSSGDDFFLVLAIGFFTGVAWPISLAGYLIKRLTD